MRWARFFWIVKMLDGGNAARWGAEQERNS